MLSRSRIQAHLRARDLPLADRASRRNAFPLSQLYVATGLIALLAGALYWFGGAWGGALLWWMGVLFVFPLAAAPIGLFLQAKAKNNEGGWRVAAAPMLGSLLIGLAWLVAVAYCAYRGYAAIP